MTWSFGAAESVIADVKLFDGYPFGPLYRLLMLTGSRKTEVSGARWREIDLAEKLWTMPPERFKSNATHLVPLSDEAVELLDALPRWKGGDFCFRRRAG